MGISFPGAVRKTMSNSKQFGRKLTVTTIALVSLAGASRLAAQVSATSQTVISKAFSNASGLAVDRLGNLYVADSATGSLSSSEGSNASPSLVLGGLNAPGQVAFDNAGNAYIANGTSNHVLEIPNQGGTLNVSATSNLGTGLGTVTGVAVDASNNVYVVDATNKQVVKIVGTTQTVLATGLTAPKQIAVDRLGDVFVADAGANKVVYLPFGGGAALTVGSGLNAPAGVATDASNNIYIADTANGRVVEVLYGTVAPTTTQNVLTTTIASPSSLALDTRGTVYIASGTSVYRYTFGSIYMGLLPVQTTSQTFPVTLSFASAITPAAIKVVTTGITGLDYKDAGGDTCAPGAYAAGASCVVNVTFTPAGVGPRYGAIVLYSSTNQVVGRVFLGGGGLGAMLTIDPGTTTSVAPTVNAPAPGTALATPHGLTTDAAGDIFIADTGVTYNGVTYPARILEIPAGQTTATVIDAAGNNDVAINGAGDLIIASGGSTVTVLPNENGTWNAADLITLGTGYTRARVAKTDVGGNIFWCDASTNSAYKQPFPTTSTVPAPTKLGFTTYSSACVGITLDLYGNIATADSTNGKILYIPVNGATPYETGSGFTGAWGVAFDASGSVWVSSDSVKELGRIPNENGTMVGADQTLSTTGNSLNYDIWLDNATGTLYTTPGSGTLVTAFNSINRLSKTITFTSTAIGAINATTAPFILSSSGNLAPNYTNGGYISLYDTADFPSIAPASPACNFTLPLAIGFTCNITYEFAPQSSGTRNETIEFTSDAAANAVINLTGPSSTTVSGTVALTPVLTTPAGVSPNPGQPLLITATAKPSGTTAATGEVTFTVDGTPFNAVALPAADTATLSIPAGLALGSHTIGVTYSGDKNYAPITAPVTLTITVVAATSSVTLTASGTDVAVNQVVTFSAVVPTGTGLATPTGTVTFQNTTTNTAIGTAQLNSNGVATLNTYAFPTAGTDAIQAIYAGDKVYTGSTSTSVTINVGAFTSTTTSLSVTPTQPTGGYVFGSILTATITVAPQSGTTVASGTVEVFLDGAPAASSQLNNGSATVTLSSIAAGSHTLTAYYLGNSTFASSGSTTFNFSIIKAATATTLSISSTANYASVLVTLTATVSNVNVPAATPSGNVTFYSGATNLGTVTLSGGTAQLATTLLPVGNDSITAVYQGDINDVSSPSSAMVDVVTIVPTTTTLSASPSVITSGGTSVLTATVVGAPVTGNFNGIVSFYLNGSTTAVGTANVSSGGIATYTTAALTAPVTSYTACYSGNPVYTQSCTSGPTAIYLTDDNGSGVIATTTLGSGLASATGTAVDISGNLYIADGTTGSVVRVAGGAGAQTTVASGLPTPAGLATDGNGDLFIANGTAGHVTKYTATNGVLGTTGTPLGTGLGTITGVAVDPSGNVYAADSTNKQLVKIAPAGTQTVLTNTLLNPQQVAVDSLGDVYVADGTGNRVVYVPAGGTATTVGTGLLNPTGVTVDVYNNVYISDTGNNRVVKLAYTAGAPPTTQTIMIGSIASPGQLAIDRHIALFISQGKSIYKWQSGAASFGVLTPGLTSPTYTLTFTFATPITPAAINVLSSGLTGGEFGAPSGSTCTAGTAYTAGQSCTVNVNFTPTIAGIRPGAVTFTTAGGQPLLTAYLGGVLYAPAFNYDNPTNPLNKGVAITPGTGTGSTVAGVSISLIRGIAVDASGNIYICDYSNSRIVQTNAAGSVGRVVYSGTSCGSVGVDGAGNVIVDDMGKNQMLLLPNENGTVNGNDAYVVASGFSGPRGMGLDGYGNIYVADSTNVRVVVTPIGSTSAQFSIPTITGLKGPDGVAVDWQGNIAVVDGSLNQVIYTPAAGTGSAVVGPPLCGAYGVAMDGGGAIYATETSEPTATACTTNVTPGDDVVRIVPGSTLYEEPDGHATYPYNVTLDPQGNLYTAYAGNIVVQNRTALPLTFTSTVGVPSVAQNVVLTNGGPAPATFTNTAGIFYIDSLDYSVATGATSACDFTTPLAGGGGCEFGITFDPTQSGTRTADFTPAANEINQAYVVLTGTATGGSTTATTLTLTSAPTTLLPYHAVTFTTAFSGGTGSPTGTITITIDGVILAEQKVAAALTFSDPAGLSPGFHTVVATYSGDSSNTSSTATLVVSSAGATPSSIALTFTPSTIAVLTTTNYTTCSLVTAQPYYSCTPVTFTATVTGSASGPTPTTTVEFLDGTTVLGTAKLSGGVATFVYNGSFSEGTHSITAEYIGDLTYAAAITSPQSLLVVYPGDYTLSLNNTNLTLTPGQTATITITAMPVPNAPGGFYNGDVGLTCTGLPIYATCAVSPNTLHLDGSGTSVTGTLTIITEAKFAQNMNTGTVSKIKMCLLPGASLLLLLGAGTRKRRRNLASSFLTRNLIVAFALATFLSSIVACGSHQPLAATAGTYTVTISGTGTGSVNHSVTMQVVIQ